ncbi:hypothetical protein [Cellulomonas massiliensis]|uniref:hypothetical protein n=1 Tax=Cellulomonas massiliensis TaxID=1465811 RepID=UPI00030673AF|nr:hypothetical protein [Cellulomonas massiliensis]
MDDEPQELGPVSFVLAVLLLLVGAVATYTFYAGMLVPAVVLTVVEAGGIGAFAVRHQRWAAARERAAGGDEDSPAGSA